MKTKGKLFAASVRNNLALLLIVLNAIVINAQTDTEFWFVAPEVTTSHADDPIVFRISASVNPAQVQISQPANPAFIPINVSIAANTTSTVDLTPFMPTIENQPPDQVLNYGLLITSSVSITAYYEVNAGNNPELFPLKGSNAKGLEFYLPFQSDFNNGNFNPPANSGFDIVSTDDNNVITITPTTDLIGGHTAGTSFTVTLNRGQTWSGISTTTIAAQHPAGTHVTSTKPICITIKDDSAVQGNCLDLMGDQMIPVPVIGTEYIVMRGFLGAQYVEKAYVLATEDNTEIFVGGSATPAATLNTGQQFVLDVIAQSTYFIATNPVYVLHVSGSGNGCELGSAILPAIRCTGSSGVFFTRSTPEQFGLNIMCRNGSENNFLLNGSNLLVPGSAFTIVPGTNNEWMAAQIQYDATEVSVGATSLLVNTADSLELFHLGIINGGASTGCRYGYFSDFSGTNLGGNKYVCLGDSLELDAGFGKDSYEWSTGDTTQFISVFEQGEYWVVTVKDGCTNTDTVLVAEDNPTITLGPDTLLCGTPSIILSPGPGFVSYVWQDNSGLSQFNATEDGIYSVEVTTLTGCSATDSVEVNFSALPPQLTITSISPLCEGEDLEISASGASGTIQWTGPNSYNSSAAADTFFDAQINLSGTYSVVQFSTDCASIPSTVNVVVNENPVPNITGDTLICEGEVSTLFASPGGFATNSWSNDSTTSSINAIGGNYSVVVTNQSGCSGIDSLTIYLTEPVADFTTDVGYTVLLAVPVAFTDSSASPAITPITSYFWDFGDGNTSTETSPVHAYADTGTYIVTHVVVNTEDCLDTITKTIKVFSELIIPDSFSPNGDNVNDFFVIQNLEAYKTPVLTIFNRWGRIVYKSDNYQNDWSGDNVTDGTYFYVLIVEDASPKDYKGTVFLIR